MTLFCHITTLVDDEPYPDLLKEKGGIGFPYIVFLDADGDVLAKFAAGYSSRDLVTSLDAVEAWQANRQKAEGGDQTATLAVLRAQLQLMCISSKEAQERWARIKGWKTLPRLLSAEDRARLEQDLINLEYKEITDQMARAGPFQKSLRKAGEKMLVLMEAGRKPDGVVERTCLLTLTRYAYVEGEDDLLVDVATKLIAKLDRKKPQDLKLIELLEKQVAEIRNDE